MACFSVYKHLLYYILIHFFLIILYHAILFGQLGGLNFVFEIKEREYDPKLGTKVCSQLTIVQPHMLNS